MKFRFIGLTSLVLAISNINFAYANFPEFEYYAHAIVKATINPPASTISINGATLMPNHSMPVVGGSLVAIDYGNNGDIDELFFLARDDTKDFTWVYSLPSLYIPSTGATSGTVLITQETLRKGDIETVCIDSEDNDCDPDDNMP